MTAGPGGPGAGAARPPDAADQPGAARPPDAADQPGAADEPDAADAADQPDAAGAHARRVLETALYVEDPVRSAAFYGEVLGLAPILEAERLIALDAGSGSVLLLFRRGVTQDWVETPGGRIPPHGADGPSHFALAVDVATLPAWRARLAAHRVEIESEVTWPRGGVSLYLRDPDGHSVELATPGVWRTY